MTSQTYETLNKAWKQTCKVILGEEVGELKDYESWLMEYNGKGIIERKSRSGKSVYTGVTEYCGSARFANLEELAFQNRQEPLNINQIKDIDSIVEALQERFVYTGNVVLGNSKDVEGSSNVQNSFHVLDSAFVFNAEYVAYSHTTRFSKYMFGATFAGQCDFIIRGFDAYESTRCMEQWNPMFCSDCHFGSNLNSCQNALFCFNIRSKRNVIGNIELPKDRFAALRSKLMDEIRDYLKKEKRLPSLLEMVGASPKKPKLPKFVETGRERKTDKSRVESAFGEATRIVLGKELHDMDSYKGWMMRHVIGVTSCKSALSGKDVYCSPTIPFKEPEFPQPRMVKDEEADFLGEKLKMDEKDISSLESVSGALWKIAFFTLEHWGGKNTNIMEAPNVYDAADCYHGNCFFMTSGSAFCWWARDSKYMFGSFIMMYSNFCIKANHSANISRSFEVDNCRDCADIYYSHNCENVHDSMFCFNIKNVRNAIGNGVLPLDKYKAVKKSLLEQIADELEKKKTLKWDIYNIGCAK